MASPRWTLSTYDLKSLWMYVLYLLAIGVVANLTGIEQAIMDFMIQNNIPVVCGQVLYAALAILAKKLAQWQNDLSS